VSPSEGERQSAEQPSLVLLRLGGDLTTKAKPTRRQFLRRLVKNLKDALRTEGVSSELRRTHDRLFIETLGPAPMETLARVFGVQSLSQVERRPWGQLEDVVEAGASLFGEVVRDKRFAVRARRVGDRSRIELDSREVERRLGAALAPLAAGVDLSNPQATAHVELMSGEAYFHAGSMRARGGLPLGVEGRAVALVSGGIDSPVAVWQLLKRGVAQDYVFCNLGGRTHQLGALRVMKVIAERWSYGTRPRFHAIDFDAVSRDLQESAETRYWQILLKRLMLRAAERVAGDRGAEAVVTGEAVGQVSSQTLRNLAVISEATGLPILRPLVGFNKDEIIDVAREIGTFELSKVVGEYCAMVPRKPATAARLETIRSQESRLDPELLERAVAERSVFDMRSLDPAVFDLPELEMSEVPEGVTLIDLRSRSAYRHWHYPEALLLDFASALAAYRSFDRDQTYLLYCEFGLKSAHLADLMRREDFRAFHFRGGLKDLIPYARKRGLATPEA
jgi:thiamine biosynthesis protein ThiI